MKKLLKVLDDHAEDVLAVILMSAATLIIVFQVIMRYVFNNSLAWTEEMARYLFLWSIWLGASYGVKTKGHVRLTVLTSRLSEKAQNIIGVIVYFIWLLFVIFLVVKGYELVGKLIVSGQTSTALHLPMWIAYASVPVGCTLMTIRMIQLGIETVKNRKAGKEA